MENKDQEQYMTNDEFFDYMENSQGYTPEELEELNEYMNLNHGEVWNEKIEEVPEPIKLTRWHKFLIWIGLKKHPHQIVEVEEEEADLLDIEAGEYVLSPRKLELRQQRQEMRYQRKIEREKMRQARKMARGTSFTHKSGKKLDPKQVALLVAIGAVGIVAYSLYKKSKRR